MDEPAAHDETAAVPNDEFCATLVRAYLMSRGMKDVVRVLDSELPAVCLCNPLRLVVLAGADCR